MPLIRGPIVVDADELRQAAAAVRSNFIHPDILAERLEEMLERASGDDLLAAAIAELRRLPCRRHLECEHCRVIREFVRLGGSLGP